MTEQVAANLLSVPTQLLADELLTDILVRPGVRIERIVSFGQVTPADRPFPARVRRMAPRIGDDWVGHILADDVILAMPEIGIEVPLAKLYDGLAFDRWGGARELRL